MWDLAQDCRATTSSLPCSEDWMDTSHQREKAPASHSIQRAERSQLSTLTRGLEVSQS